MNRQTSKKTTGEGTFALVNKSGQIARVFNWDSPTIFVIFRHDTRRVETVATLEGLEQGQVSFDVLAESTPAEIMEKDLKLGTLGMIRYVDSVGALSPNYELQPEEELDRKKVIGWAFALQVGVALVALVGGVLTGNNMKKEEVTVALIPQDMVERMLKEEPKPRPMEKQRLQANRPVPPKRKIVVAPSEKKITKNTPVPTRSANRTKVAKAPRGAGYKSAAQRGSGTAEPRMNQIGALGALTKASGNGGRGGLNLQAAGQNAGSGAGGSGYGGFGSNGGGGRGRGGLARGSDSGLNSMYGKGMVAAPHGGGSPAPGAGSYGTRGKAGGGAQGAGYGSQTLVGSWKGTGGIGNGPAGSGAGNGNLYGSPYGLVDGEGDDAIVTGGLDRDQIAAVILRNLGQITYCYEQGLQRKPALSGRVAVRFQIGASGRVETAGVKHSSVRHSQVESCIVSKLRTWKFPKPQGGVTVAVTYPFELRRSASNN
jgi:TonB family protein